MSADDSTSAIEAKEPGPQEVAVIGGGPAGLMAAQVPQTQARLMRLFWAGLCMKFRKHCWINSRWVVD